MKEKNMINFDYISADMPAVGYLEVKINNKMFRFYDTVKFPDMPPVALYETSEFFDEPEYCLDESEALLEMIK